MLNSEREAIQELGCANKQVIVASSTGRIRYKIQANKSYYTMNNRKSLRNVN